MAVRGRVQLKKLVIIIFPFLAFCFCLSPAVARAENWTHFDTDRYGKWYYDEESLAGTRTGIVVFWVKVVYSKEGLRGLLEEAKGKGTYKKNFDSLHYSLSNYACECDELTCGLQGVVAYNIKGDVVNVDSPSPVTEKWEKPVGGSGLEKLIGGICRMKK